MILLCQLIEIAKWEGNIKIQGRKKTKDPWKLSTLRVITK